MSLADITGNFTKDTIHFSKANSGNKQKKKKKLLKKKKKINLKYYTT